MAKNSVEDIDRGFSAMLKRLLGADGTLTVGIHAAQGDEAKDDAPALTVAQVAAFHEFGLGVPRRSFIADWADENEEKHKQQFRDMAKAVLDGRVKDPDQALARLGNLYVAEVQRRMSQGIDPPLKQSTIDRKGSSKPLINTGQMRSSVTFVVSKGGGGQ